MPHAISRTLELAALGAALTLTGCAPRVGTRAANCDEELARQIVYEFPSGTPAYIGQAILIQSCANGGGGCHTASREPSVDRYGAPFGLDFDATLVPTGSPVETPLAEDEAALGVLARVQATIHRRRNDIWAAVVSGAMPPGEAGRANDRGVNMPMYHYVPRVALDPVPIELITSAEGRESLRNWLACGSPVIERTTHRASPRRCTADAECLVSNRCDTVAGECVGVGDVVPGLDLEFEPSFPDIYALVIGPSCAALPGCHGPAPRSAGLDMSTEMAAYASLVGTPAGDDITGMCGGMGLTRVVPGDPDSSLIVLKLEGAPPCGSPMPFGPPLNPAIIAAIREWVALGALRFPEP